MNTMLEVEIDNLCLVNQYILNTKRNSSHDHYMKSWQQFCEKKRVKLKSPQLHNLTFKFADRNTHLTYVYLNGGRGG